MDTRSAGAPRRRPHREPAGSLRDYLPAAALLTVGLAALAVSWFLSGPNSGQYLVIASPTTSLTGSIDLVRRAGGRLAATSTLPNIVIAGSDRDDFPATLRLAGAWLAVPVPPVAGCITSSAQEPNP
ncbi:hypothetical protein [Novosphingobium resinovorum]|uniref:hypothetical protein n=1 Tax=Novosphingobium resinovorum TaxID=158500 RepID=UPI002ED5D538|nr:hypothetical protein [Novosphingobium resinovorum]